MLHCIHIHVLCAKCFYFEGEHAEPVCLRTSYDVIHARRSRAWYCIENKRMRERVYLLLSLGKSRKYFETYYVV